ncbi:hypothetical protein KIW84_063441 [Lathyrus oleraceus]|uniref:RNase H type-1 domain-containing protein n=1 Tax=Pisum sativum TaxID=3888 RepID=A0A9D5A4V8_PEA|nr:hypothetical protein KIW84_063441 [Pisum sativum]
MHVRARFKEYEDAIRMDKKVVGRNNEVMLIKWNLPKPGMTKLNVDGACIKGVAAGCGGTVRDDKAHMVENHNND